MTFARCTSRYGSVNFAARRSSTERSSSLSVILTANAIAEQVRRRYDSFHKSGGNFRRGVLRVGAERGDLWNIPGGDIDDCVRRSALPDRCCAEVGRDPASITRSIHLAACYDRPATTRHAITQAIDAGFRHNVVGLRAPYPEGVAHWIAGELVDTST